MVEKRVISAGQGEFKGEITGNGEGDTEIEHVEAMAGADKPKKSERVKRHFARFWCCYLLAGTIFSAIFLPVL